ncbi:phasin family protein [Radicibacter daui]|uniref:phasin family protein n=1 Tax=Radicibacter daui TaxID=3064829 RepID=UPI004046E644
MTATNPFLDIDFTKLMADFKVPGVDMNALVTAQRKNIEALTQANQLAFEGVQAVLRRQTEIFRQTMEEANVMLRELMAASAPEEKVAKETELLKAAFEKALGNMTELAEMVSKSNKEAADVISKRVVASLDEVKTLVTKLKTASK